VIGPRLNYVDVYQSFGSSRPIYRVNLVMREFENCIEIFKRIKRTGKNFLNDINDMLYIETNLYNINLENYFIRLFRHKENPDNVEPDEEEINSARRIIDKILEQYPELVNTLRIYDRHDGYSPTTIIDVINGLESDYMSRPVDLVLDEYIPTYMKITAGKRNKRKNKTHKKSNSKKYKRKTKKIKRTRN
jgi:hypothetical protein